MKFSLTLVALAAAGFASAQLPPIPGCATPCFVSALGSGSSCGLLDFKCQCARTDLTGPLVSCVKEKCPEKAEQSSVSSVVSSECSKAGVPVSIPPVDEPTTAPPVPTTTDKPAEPTPTATDKPVEPTPTDTTAPPKPTACIPKRRRV